MPTVYSVEQQRSIASRHADKFTKSSNKAIRKEINDFLKNDAFLEPTREFLTSLANFANGNGKKADVVAKCALDGALPDMTRHQSYTTLLVTPSKILKHLLQRIDRVAFADPILKFALQTQQQREPPKEELSEYIEFMTDIPNDKLISVADRDLDRMAAKVDRQKKPKRIAGVLLPADFNRLHGIYEAIDRRTDGDGVWLRYRHEHNEGMKKIPKDFSGALSFEKNFSKTKARICDDSGDDGYLCCMLFSDKELKVADCADQQVSDGHDGSTGGSFPHQRENAEDSKLEVDACGVFSDGAEETSDDDTYEILSRDLGLGSDPHACVAAPPDKYENADVLESIEPGSDGDEDDDSFSQQLALLSGRLSQRPFEIQYKQKTADDLKAKVDTPTLASPKRPFVVDIEQEKHTPTTTSKTQKNWMKAFAEKARGQGHQ